MIQYLGRSSYSFFTSIAHNPIIKIIAPKPLNHTVRSTLDDANDVANQFYYVVAST